jgi:hypothetical protein
MHHLFYKGVAAPLGLRGAPPLVPPPLGAASPGATSPCAASLGAGPLGLQGCGPLGFTAVRHPMCRLPWVPPPLEPGLGGRLPPINVTLHLSIQSSNSSPLTEVTRKIFKPGAAGVQEGATSMFGHN